MTSTRRTGPDRPDAGGDGGQRYGGTGSLESRDTAGTRDASGQRGQNMGGAGGASAGQLGGASARNPRIGTMAS